MIPPTVNIFGIPYKVERVPYIDREYYIVGKIKHESQKILILDSLSEELAEQTLLHEVIHGILMQLRRNEEHDDEPLVQGLAIGLHLYLKGDFHERNG